MRLTPKNWREFQHYKDRSPPWIKLHRKLLDDRTYACLPLASKALAPLLWLLASEGDENGEFDADTEELMFRLRLSRKEVTDGVAALVAAGMFTASTPLASCLQVATESVSVSPSASPLPLSGGRVGGKGEELSTPDFDRFWEAYDKKKGRSAALRAWKRLAPSQDLVAKLLAAIPPYVEATPDKQYRKDPATWLNGGCWDDEIIKPRVGANGKPAKAVTHIQNMPLGASACPCAACERYR